MEGNDGILRLLEDPNVDQQLNTMTSWELEGLSFGIHQLEKVFRRDSKLFLGLKNLESNVKFAHDYVGLMNGIDRLLDQNLLPNPK